MSELEQNTPDDFWRKSFEEANEIPPPRVWDAIERRLDEDKGAKILPLWAAGLVSSRPFVWSTGAAAAVAVFILGWWNLRPTAPETAVAHHRTTTSQSRSAITAPTPMATDCWPSLKTVPIHPSSPDKQGQEMVALNPNSTSARGNSAATIPTQSASRPAAASLAQLRAPLDTPTPAFVGDEQVAAIQPPQTTRRMAMSIARAGTPPTDRMGFAGITTAPITPFNDALPATSSVSVPVEQALSFERRQALVPRLREPVSIQRIVWFRPTETAMAPTAARLKGKTKEVWASVSLMPGAFNPSVTVQPAQTSFTRADALSNTSTSPSSVGSRANFSVAYQAGAGIQLTEHWSVESGVGYLAGRSTVDSPAQTSVLNLQSANANRTGQGGNLYVDALRRSSSSAPSVTNSSIASVNNDLYAVQTSYNPQTRQSLRNNYQFVQVPVQVGYQLRPRKRLGLALLGGFLSNIFVRNSVGNNLVISPKDGVYRSVSWAANVGARFRYRPSRQWSASLAGVYQPSLGLSTRPESLVQARPTSTGMSFGIDYHF